MYLYSFERLEVYQLSRQLVKAVYELTSYFPPQEKFGLQSQVTRAIVSVPSNIAESCGRSSYKEKIHFIEIAYGSLMESFCQLQLAQDLNYIIPEAFESLRPKFISASKLLYCLRESYKKALEGSKGKTSNN